MTFIHALNMFFSVHARMEDLHEDTLYLLMKTGLLPILSPNKVMNTKREENNPDYMSENFH